MSEQHIPHSKPEAMDKVRLDAVITHVQNIFREGGDIYHQPPAPIFADAINVRTKEQIGWIFPDGKQSVISNLSCQQNFMRVLVALSNITGDEQYRNAARANVRYYFDHYQDANGLLRWGGHQFVDLKTLEAVGPSEKDGVHELKNAFPYYDLMFEVDAAATAKFIKAFWNAHIYDWPTLEIGRHGEFTQAINDELLWNNAPYTKQPPYFAAKGLSFLNAGNDLIYAGAMIAKYTGNSAAMLWVKRLADQFISARNPQTKLGAYQFSQPIKTEDAPSDEKTLSWFGDRAQRQFGPDFEPNPDPDPTKHRVLEATMLLKGQATTIYSENALMQLQLGHDLGEAGSELLAATRDGLLAFQHYAYEAATNTLKPMLTDGTDLSNFTLKRNGYYEKAGHVLKPYPATSAYLLSYARAYLITGIAELWGMARGIARANDLGDLGDEPGRNQQVNLATEQDDPFALFAVIDIYLKTQTPEYLQLARAIGNNIYRKRFVQKIDGRAIGYFMTDKDRVYANFDTIEPYALLALQAAIDGKPDAVPPFLNGAGYTEGDYRLSDGTVKTYQDKKLLDLKIGQDLLELAKH
jgi:pectate lyase